MCSMHFRRSGGYAMNAATFQQIKKLNNLPLNREALKHLLALGVKAELTSLYVLQLIQWNLERTDYEPYFRYQRRMMEDFLYVLQQEEDQQAVLDYLLMGPPEERSGDGPDVVAGDLRKRSPQEAASLLTEQLHAVMSIDRLLTDYREMQLEG